MVAKRLSEAIDTGATTVLYTWTY